MNLWNHCQWFIDFKWPQVIQTSSMSGEIREFISLWRILKRIFSSQEKWFLTFASCKEEWANCCGGNQNNEIIIALDNGRTTKELKKKLAQLLDLDFVNNVWCSKWSSVLAKNVIWLLLDRDAWSLQEIISLDQRFLIETVGTALAAIMKGKEVKTK